jgi:tryptophan synthase alpha chain
VSNRIDQRFQALKDQSRKALIPFITVGDPHPDWTVAIMHQLVSAGADVIELGVPFSDPMADGPVIQESSERAIARGVSLRTVLSCVRTFRHKDTATPVVLMGYMNPIERYGYEAFATDATRCGVDGVLMVDCPPEEMGELGVLLAKANIYPICLLAPTTTPERMNIIVRGARGYLYYVSFAGITGANLLKQESIVAPLEEIRQRSTLPIAVGFGIKGPATAAAIAKVADAVVIGSALVQTLAASASQDEASRLAWAFLAPVRAAMDNGGEGALPAENR